MYIFSQRRGSFAASKRQFKILGLLVAVTMLVISLPMVQAELTVVATFGSQGTGDGQFLVPRDVAINDDGNIWVVDYNNNRIEVFDSSGHFLFKFGTIGANPGQFYQPSGIAADGSGKIYATSAYYNVQKFDSSGHFLLKFGSYGTGDGQFKRPYGIAANDERIYVTDTQLFRVQVFDTSGNFLFKFGSKGTADDQFMMPSSIDVDTFGNIYVLDSSTCSVRVFDSSGGFLFKFGSQGSSDGHFYSPGGVALDNLGNIYVADSGYSRVQVFDNSGTFSYKFGTYGTGIGQFQSPYGIAVDNNGDICVVDGRLQRVQKFSSNPVDTTAPQSSLAFNPGTPTGNNGWYTNPVAISLSATDNTGGTGVSSITYSIDNLLPVTIAGAATTFTINSEGIHTVSYYATDNSQNHESIKSATLKIDLTAPTITGSKTPAANSNGWNNADVTVTFTVSDEVSGIVQAPIDQIVSGEGIGQSVVGTVVDVAGNVATLTVGDINIDKTAPIVTGAPTTLPNLNGWYNADVAVHFVASDSHSGIAGENYADITITNEGPNQQASWLATDLAGNTYACIISEINIDKTNPTTTYSLSDNPDSDGWYTSNVQVTFTSSDAISGVGATLYSDDGLQWSTYNSPIIISREGSTTIYYYSTDNAGNAEPIQTFVVNIAYTVNFIQTNLPAGTQWSITLDSATQYSTTNSIIFKVKPGTYSWIIHEITAESNTIKYISTTATGTLNVPTQLTLDIAFKTQYSITMQVIPTESATISPISGWFDEGSTISLSATPNAGYMFYSWTSNTPTITFTSAETAQTTATINGAGTIIATLPYIVNGNNKITLTGTNNVLILTGGNNQIDATQATATTIIKTGAGNNKFSFGEGNNVFTSTADGNDQITTGNGDNIITVSGKGNLKITAGNGNDIITITGKGNNNIDAGNGNNQVILNDGNNQITTGNGNDIIIAGDGNNKIQAGAGNDQITVGNGNNHIDGGAGIDTVKVGTGKNKITNCEN